MRGAPWSRGIFFLIGCQSALLLHSFSLQRFSGTYITQSILFENRRNASPKQHQTVKRRRRFAATTSERRMSLGDDETTNTTGKAPLFQTQAGAKSPSFGESVSIRNRPKETTTIDKVLFPQEAAQQHPGSGASSETTVLDDDDDGGDQPSEARIVADNLMRRNKVVAFASIVLAVSSWLWQVAHPVTPIQLLVTMEERSPDISVVGHNGKPTVVDFWAPWCENCKLSAATMFEIEAEYGDRVNFIMVNGDDMVKNGKLVEAFGVDAIPHVAMVEADGTVDTALIGPIPKRIIRANLDVLIENSSKEVHETLPYKMLDVFENRPQDRRLSF